MSFDKIGKVTVLATLGAGAQSSIVKVRREADGREYAMKIVPVETEDDKKFLDQAKHEFRVGQMLDHPNLVKVYCFETESDWRFRVKKARLLIEFVPGETLDQVKLLNHAKLLRVLEKTAAGVAHMHARGVVHADLKPNNIMIGRGTNAKVIDYGLAWIKGEPKDRVQGTPEYMAPETAMRKIVNERTDIYNFGATMYKLITGHFANLGMPSGGELGHRAKPTPPVQRDRNIPGTLSEVIMACLEPSPDRRPAGLAEIKHKLEAVAKYMGVKPDDLKTLDDMRSAGNATSRPRPAATVARSRWSVRRRCHRRRLRLRLQSIRQARQVANRAR